jgi:hypothetical protein
LIFIEYPQEMERLDTMAKLRLEDLRSALKLARGQGAEEVADGSKGGSPAGLRDPSGAGGTIVKTAPTEGEEAVAASLE